MEAVILVNKSKGADACERIAAALAQAGVTGEVEPLEGDELGARAAAAVKAGARLVIAGGGDGTVSAVAGALVGSDTALGILPLGTLNHLARDLGIPFDLDDAARLIAAGRQRRIDTATLSGRTFVNNSAVGLYPLMVADREAQEDRLGRSKKLAMLVASLRTLVRFHHHRLTLTINEADTATLDTALLFVGNNEYQIAFPSPGQRSTLDDGRLCVVAMRRQGRLALMATLLRALVGRSREADLIHFDDVTHLTVHSSRSMLTVSLDGETLRLNPPLDYRIHPAALAVIA